jgi:hypothetical protein
MFGVWSLRTKNIHELHAHGLRQVKTTNQEYTQLNKF